MENKIGDRSVVKNQRKVDADTPPQRADETAVAGDVRVRNEPPPWQPPRSGDFTVRDAAPRSADAAVTSDRIPDPRPVPERPALAAVPSAITVLEEPAVPAAASVAPALPPSSLKPPMTVYRALPTKTPADIHAALEEVKGADIAAIVHALVDRDAQEVFCRTPDAMAQRFSLADDTSILDAATLARRLPAAHAAIGPLLKALTAKVLDHVDLKNGVHLLRPDTINPEQLKAAQSQHVGYVVGAMSRLPHGQQTDEELARTLIGRYFSGTLHATRDVKAGQTTDPRILLANELAKLVDGEEKDREVVRALVLGRSHPQWSVPGFFSKDPSAEEELKRQSEWMFDPNALSSSTGLLKNLSNHWAGETTLELAKLLVGPEKAAAFVSKVFERSDRDTDQRITEPNGLESVLAQFAATAAHEAYEAAVLASAQIAARQGDAHAVSERQFNHPTIGSVRTLHAEHPSEASKVAVHISSFMRYEGLIVPCERDPQIGTLPLKVLLDHVAEHGPYVDDKSRVISRYAAAVQYALHQSFKKAAAVLDLESAWKHGADVAANAAAAFACHVVGGDFATRYELTNLYRNAIGGRMESPIHNVLVDGVPDPKDAAFKSLYANLPADIGLAAMRAHFGTARANELVENSTLDDVIGAACRDLRLPRRADYTPRQILADIDAMSASLLDPRKDYFLGDTDGFAKDFKAEADRPGGKVDAKDFSSTIRVPNAIWLFTQLPRATVENKPGRITADLPNAASNDFPSAVQFNPPEIRDVEIFKWARYRLDQDENLQEDRKTRMAMAVVALTQYKDLYQLKKAAERERSQPGAGAASGAKAVMLGATETRCPHDGFLRVRAYDVSVKEANGATTTHSVDVLSGKGHNCSVTAPVVIGTDGKPSLVFNQGDLRPARLSRKQNPLMDGLVAGRLGDMVGDPKSVGMEKIAEEIGGYVDSAEMVPLGSKLLPTMPGQSTEADAYHTIVMRRFGHAGNDSDQDAAVNYKLMRPKDAFAAMDSGRIADAARARVAYTRALSVLGFVPQLDDLSIAQLPETLRGRYRTLGLGSPQPPSERQRVPAMDAAGRVPKETKLHVDGLSVELNDTVKLSEHHSMVTAHVTNVAHDLAGKPTAVGHPYGNELFHTDYDLAKVAIYYIDPKLGPMVKMELVERPVMAIKGTNLRAECRYKDENVDLVRLETPEVGVPVDDNVGSSSDTAAAAVRDDLRRRGITVDPSKLCEHTDASGGQSDLRYHFYAARVGPPPSPDGFVPLSDAVQMCRQGQGDVATESLLISLARSPGVEWIPELGMTVASAREELAKAINSPRDTTATTRSPSMTGRC